MKLAVIAALMILLLAGCATNQPCKICRRGDPVKAFIKPAKCKDLPDGRYTCDGVIFDPVTLDAKKAQP